VFDDFAAVLKLLVSRGYTSAEHLGIIGGSNGGLLMGAMLTQRPELFRAVVSSVGIYDSLRTELEANGEFNIPEFGTVKDEAQFRALHAYSPYHHVEPGTRYPAVLLSHGDNDPRVAPWQSRKMAAALQAANVSDQQILLMTSASAGHGASSLTEAIDEYSRKLAFLLHHIGAAEPAAN
jgi:prolyl oligopeptidase